MTGWLIALGIVIAIAILPIGASFCYDESGPRIKLIVGPVKVLVFPRPKKAEKEKQKDKKGIAATTKKKPASQAPIPDGPPEGAPTNPEPHPKEKKGGSLTDFLPLLDVVLDMLSSLGRGLRVRFLQLRLIMAAEDPCDLAVSYGAAQAAGAALMARLNQMLVIKKQDVQIQCDFTSDEMKILARLDLTITVGHVLFHGVRHGIRGLTKFMKIMKQRKGGAAL